MNVLSPQDLKVQIDSGIAPTIVDLQFIHEYEHRHIPGAINIPGDQKFEEHAQETLKDKAAAIVVYGEFDELQKGSEGAERLEKLGYTNVSRLTGGLMGYMEAGFTVEGGWES
jgi:rhodanese-related sulfurtransferase